MRIRHTRDPSLRLKNGSARDDAQLGLHIDFKLSHYLEYHFLLARDLHLLEDGQYQELNSGVIEGKECSAR
jgi:hypothetical protein